MNSIQSSRDTVNGLINIYMSSVQNQVNHAEERGIFENIRFDSLSQLDDLEDIESSLGVQPEEGTDALVEEPVSKAATLEYSKSAFQAGFNKGEPTTSSTSSDGATRQFHTLLLLLGGLAWVLNL